MPINQSLKNRIFESLEKNKNSDGQAIVSRITKDVFGESNTTKDNWVRSVLNSCGVACQTRGTYYLRRAKIAKPEINVPPSAPTEIQSEPDDLDVELYLAIKAKSGCKKAFRILKQLV